MQVMIACTVWLTFLATALAVATSTRDDLWAPLPPEAPVRPQQRAGRRGKTGVVEQLPLQYGNQLVVA